MWIKTYFQSALTSEAKPAQRFFVLLNLLLPVFTGAFIFLNTMPFSALSEAALFLSLGSLFLLILFKKISFFWRTPLTLPFALFLLWAILGLFFALDLKNSIHDLIHQYVVYLVFSTSWLITSIPKKNWKRSHGSSSLLWRFFQWVP